MKMKNKLRNRNRPALLTPMSSIRAKTNSTFAELAQIAKATNRADKKARLAQSNLPVSSNGEDTSFLN